VCHYDDDGWGDEWTFDFNLGAGDRRVDFYPWSHRVEVRIYGHDGALIFSRTYTPDAFESSCRFRHGSRARRWRSRLARDLRSLRP